MEEDLGIESVEGYVGKHEGFDREKSWDFVKNGWFIDQKAWYRLEGALFVGAYQRCKKLGKKTW